MSDPILSLRGVRRTYPSGERTLEVLRGRRPRRLSRRDGRLVGPSGSGKSSLLHAAGLLERPDGGAILIEGQDCSKLWDRARTRLLLGRIGFVYQFHHLLPEFSALDNVAMPARIAGAGRLRRRTGRGRCSRGWAWASGPSTSRPSFPGASSSAWPWPAPWSTGRGSCSPTSPRETSTRRLRRRCSRACSTCAAPKASAALIATHNMELARYMDRVFALEDGHLVRRQAA